MNTKKRILFVITKATWGGAQKYVYDLARNLPEGSEPVVAFGEHGKLADDLTRAGIATRDIPAMRRDVSLLSDAASFFALVKCIRGTKPDVVHLNSSKAAALGALAARLCRGFGGQGRAPKIIFTAHGWPFNEPRSTAARTLIYLISWFTALLSDAVIVVSRSDEAQGERMWLVGRKIRYIPIGVEPPTFLARDEAASRLGITTAMPRIVTIAELTQNKGLRYAIEAIALLKQRDVDVSYFLIGEGELREELRHLARKRDIADRVHFLGFRPDASQYLKAFDLFLLPSVKEGMPYVLLEAALAQLPIITTSVVNPEVVDGYENVRAVPPGDQGAIAEAIVASAQTQEERELFPLSNPFSYSAMRAATSALY